MRLLTRWQKVVNWLIPPKKYTQSAIEMQMNPYREVVQSVAQVCSEFQKVHFLINVKKLNVFTEVEDNLV